VPELQETIEALAAIAREVRHCGDCGWLLYNEQTGAAFWCAADGDPISELDALEQFSQDNSEQPGTPVEEIGEKMRAVPGVTSFDYEQEAYPDEEGWLWVDYRLSPPLLTPAAAARL
jgi:hypothetical protein